MSLYKIFVTDFPDRCADILARYEEQASSDDREVTLMLCIAATGVTFPLERLDADHPARDAEIHSDAARAYNQLKNKDFLDSILWPCAEPGSWEYGRLKTVDGEPDTWPELQGKLKLTREPKVEQILRHIRNALAHANVFTQGTQAIERIVLLSNRARETPNNPKPPPDWWFLQVSPDDLRRFLDNWFAFLKKLQLPAVVVSE